MAEKLNEETVWYLKKMMEMSDKDFAEERTYSHDQVKEMLKARRHESEMVTACI